MEVLEKFGISKRVLGITTDNATNNATLYRYVRDIGQNSGLIKIPSVAHVIQLCLTGLLDDLKLRPDNEVPERDWPKAKRTPVVFSKQDQIIGTLTKVSKFPFF